MIAAPHAAIGAAIGVAVGDPVGGFVLGFVSHFLGDRTPHTESTTFYGKSPRLWKQRFRWFLVDAVATVALMGCLLWRHAHFHSAFWGMLGGLVPDLITNIPWLGDRLSPHWGFRQFRTFHHWTHCNLPKVQWKLGVMTQVIALAISVAYLLYTR